MTNWSSLLSSKCEDRDSFLSFYSKTKGILRKLDKGCLIASKDKVFLKAYSSMEAEATELQTEVTYFLRDMNATYLETLELTHADFRVQTTGDHLRDTTTRLGPTGIVRRVKPDDNINPKKTDVPPNKNRFFLNNHGKLLPSEYYRQFREWYKVFSTFKSYHPPAQLSWIDNFKFNFDVAQHAVCPRSNQRNEPRHDGASRQNWNSVGGGQNDLRCHIWYQ